MYNKEKVCCFGEALLRFSPGNGFLEDASMPAFLGGAELNVATALAAWDTSVKYITALPDNYLAEEIIGHIKARNINTDEIIYSGDRVGSYYLRQGADLKNNSVIYDRQYSSFSVLKPGDIDWSKILENVSRFHFSAICPALSEQSAAVCLEAVQAAASKNIIISVDLNYRSKLWKYGKEPAAVMKPLLEYCDLIMGNIWSAEKLAGIDLPKDFVITSLSKAELIKEATSSAKKIMQVLPRCKTVANTFRFDTDAGINYYATLHTAGENYCSAEYNVSTIIDRSGSGDCFMGGLIYGSINKFSSQDTVDFSAAAAVAKLQQKGDATASTITEVKQNINHG